MLVTGEIEMFKDQYKIIGLNIRYYRSLRGYTQQRLSSLAGISRSIISDLECGKGAFNIETLLLIAAALDVDLKSLLKEKE